MLCLAISILYSLPDASPSGVRSGAAGALVISLNLSATRGIVTTAAARMLARLGGEELPEGGALALGQVAGVAELVRFYLSDAYHELRTALGEASGRL